jgi:hypothetical protein
LITLALVGLSLGGFRFSDKREIWGVRSLQTLPFSPPVEKGERGANDDYQDGKGNPEI